jgi:hypothetical protein
VPFFLPWLRVNVFIRLITDHVWPDQDWPIARAHLGRAHEIRRDLSRAPWWNSPPLPAAA